MNYTELKTNIQDVCEDSFTTAQLDLFITQAEERIYNAVQIPALRETSTGVFTASNRFLTAPTDLVWTYSMSVVDSSSDHHTLINKDVNFIREAYPNATTEGLPKHYALFDDSTFIVAPTPNTGYAVQIHYGRYPETIITATTTWLGDNFESVLMNGCLVEAIRFQKGEGDMVQLYQNLYIESLMLLKNLGDGKLRSDVYRSGQPRSKVV
jgi:hypothetical protein|tara:strand:+ start:6349 stop:6978 length:630 start_codon:yes stop_codon:yes gene_type:complete